MDKGTCFAAMNSDWRTTSFEVDSFGAAFGVEYFAIGFVHATLLYFWRLLAI